MTRVIASRAHYAAHLAPVAALMGDVPVTLVASYTDHQAARAHRDPIVVMEHGIGQSYGNAHPSYPGGRDRGDAALFLTPNEHSARRWRAAYPSIPAVAIGSPRLDALPARVPGEGPVVAVGFHWPCMAGAPWSGWAFPEYHAAIARLAERVKVIGHGHPRAMPTLARWYERVGIEVVESFDDVCRRADLYVCDNSSTLFEFAATGRPVVVLNSRSWRGEGPGLRFWEASVVGLNVTRPEALAAVVESTLVDPLEVRRAREYALGIVYAHRAGAAQRAVEAITSLITVRAAA